MGVLSSGSIVVGERGAYVVESKRLEGGMGYVHWGREQGGTGRHVVLKTAKEGTDKDDLIKQKLFDEADILRAVSHPNIVRYVDRRPAGQFVLVLECVEGQSFHDAFRGKPASEDQTRIYADTMLDALQYLHSRNIIYRDVKPQNIINEPGRRLVLLDFGAAKQGYLHTKAGTLVGSNGWSAPEQFTTGEVTEASDIYGLGATLFFILTGKEPRGYMLHDGSLMKGPRDLNPSVSKELSEAVLRAVQSDPRLRPQTADDMRKLLRGTYSPLGAPNIVVSGRRYEVRAALEIGRTHDCRVRGCTPTRRLDVPIDDPSKFVGSHQARLSLDRSGRVWVEDLGAVNRMAVLRRGQGWDVVRPRSRYELRDKDQVALAYADGRGPYITFTFNMS